MRGKSGISGRAFRLLKVVLAGDGRRTVKSKFLSVSGNIVLIKNAPHFNAATLFISWLLSTDGQTAFTRALGRLTRHLDVDTQWTQEFGYVSAKEALTLEKYDEMEDGSEERGLRARNPTMKLAEKLFQ